MLCNSQYFGVNLYLLLGTNKFKVMFGNTFHRHNVSLFTRELQQSRLFFIFVELQQSRLFPIFVG